MFLDEIPIAGGSLKVKYQGHGQGKVMVKSQSHVFFAIVVI